MTKFIIRILMFGLGLFLTYSFGRDTFEPLWLRISGVRVEGRISGFLAGRYGPSVQREPDGVRNGKRRARRPVFVYPVAAGSTDSLECRSGSRALFTFTNYDLNERVTVVFKADEPAKAYIFGWQLIAMSFLLTLVSLYMLRIGVLGKLD